MRKWRTLVMVILMLLVFVSVSFAANKDYGDFLALNQRSEGELISAGKTTKMKIGKNPITIFTTGRNHVLFCAGDYSYNESSQKVKVLEEGTLSIYNPITKVFEVKRTFKATPGWYLLDKTNTIMWLITLKGNYEKDKLNAVLYQINLITFETKELPLKDDAYEIEMSSDEKWLAISYPGLPEAEGSTVILVDLHTLEVTKEYKVGKNPTLLRFNENNSALMIACDGDIEKGHKTAGVWVFDLSSYEMVLQKSFGTAVRSFIVAEDNQRFYGVVATDALNKYKLIAFDITGFIFETEISFIPQSIQQQPDTEQLIITDDEHEISEKTPSALLIINAKTGQIVKEMNLRYILGPLVFIQNSPVAYIHSIPKKKRKSQSDRYLLCIDLNTFELKEAVRIGPASEFSIIPVSKASYTPLGKLDKLNKQLTHQYTLITEAQDKIYVLNNVSEGNNIVSSMGSITVYDTVTNKVANVIKYKSLFFINAGGFLFTPNQKFIIIYTQFEVILINTNTNIKTYQEAVNAKGMYVSRPLRNIIPFFTPDGTKLLVENNTRDIFVIDLETGEQIDTIPSKIPAKTILYWIQ